MSNYIYQQSPWVGAANAMSGVTDAVSQAIARTQALRQQGQFHADQMGIQQGQLELENQRTQAQIPLYQSEQAMHQAQADKYKADAVQQAMINAFAPRAGEAKRQMLLRLPQGQQGPPTPEMSDVADYRSILATIAGLNPASAMGLLESEQKPLMVGQNQTAIDPATLAVLARGQGSAPVGNTVFNPSVGGAQPTVQQQGQFRPSLGQQNPGADLGHLNDFIKGQSDNLAWGTSPQATNANALASVLLQQVAKAYGITNGPAMGQPQSPITIKSVTRIK